MNNKVTTYIFTLPSVFARQRHRAAATPGGEAKYRLTAHLRTPLAATRIHAHTIITKINFNNLRASTILEVIVASVIFLVVFAVSLETMTRLTVSPDEGPLLVEVDCRMKERYREFAPGLHACGTYKKEYPWGAITVTVAPYRDYDRLHELTLTARIDNSRKQFTRKYLIENGY